jgi:hypothetical protein
MYNSSDSEDDAPDAMREELPQGIYFHKKSGKYCFAFRRGGRLYCSRYSNDIGWLVHWKDNKDKELDEAGVQPVRKKKKQERAAFQSDTPGVNWHSGKKKWRGNIYDRLECKIIHTSPCLFVHETDCADAVAKLRAEEAARFEAEIAKRVAADPKLTGLHRAPKDNKDAEKGVVYWHVHTETKYVPYRAIVVGPQNNYTRACQECHQSAVANTPKGKVTHCIQHGGGRRCLGPLGCTECPLGIAVHLGKADVYDGRCSRCFCHSFPNDHRAARARSSVHAREHATTDELKKHFPDYNWTFDKTFSHRTFLVGVSTRFRPDARTTQGDRVIIIEIDEQSHRGYLCAKEREREESFVKQNRNKTVVMIRFNPDEYTDYEGVRHPSCFTNATKDTQVTHLHPKRKANWQTRIQELVNTVRNVLDPKFPLPPKQPDRPLLICELFYDDVMATPEDRRVAKALAANKAIGKRKRDTS